MLLETANLEDKTGHLVVNICFDVEKADSKTIMYNKLDPSIFEKQNFSYPSEKYVFQLSETMRLGEKSSEILPF